MKIADFITSFAEQLEDTAPASILPETKFREIEEWSSLTALSVIAMVDAEYGVKLTGDEIRRAQTVADLFEIVSAKR